MASDAAIRASYAKTVIATIKRCPAQERDTLLSRIDATLRQDIRERSLLDWLPVRDFAALVELVADALGPVRAKAFWRANLRSSLENTLLSPLRLGAVGLYGDVPSSLLRMAPQAWHLASRGCGRCHTKSAPPSGFTLYFTGLPPELCNPAMGLLWSGGSESCIEHLGYRGHAEAQVGQLEAGSATVDVQWEPR